MIGNLTDKQRRDVAVLRADGKQSIESAMETVLRPKRRIRCPTMQELGEMITKQRQKLIEAKET